MVIEYQTLAKIFNSNTLSAIANEDLSYVFRIVDQFFDGNDNQTLANIFEESFKILSKYYSNEYVYKNFIVNKKLLGKHSLNTATMLSEFRVGRNKADSIILNGKSTCYEIKTDYDSLIRLDDQLSSYSQLFDEVNVICSHKHVDSVLTQASKNIGVILLSDKNTFRTVRHPVNRREKLNKSLLIKSLRQDEYITLVESLYGITVKAPNTQIFDICNEKIQQFDDEKKLNHFFIEILKKSRKNNDILISRLPYSLRNAAVSYKFNKNQIATLINCFDNKEGDRHVLSYFERKIK